MRAECLRGSKFWENLTENLSLETFHKSRQWAAFHPLKPWPNGPPNSSQPTHPLEKNDHSHHMSNTTEMIIAIIPASKLPGYLVVWRSYSKWRLAIWFGVISKEERSNTRCKRSCQDSESNPNPNPTLGSSTTFLTT